MASALAARIEILIDMSLPCWVVGSASRTLGSEYDGERRHSGLAGSPKGSRPARNVDDPNGSSRLVADSHDSGKLSMGAQSLAHFPLIARELRCPDALLLKSSGHFFAACRNGAATGR